MENKFKGTQGKWQSKGMHIFSVNEKTTIGQSFIVSMKISKFGRHVPDQTPEYNAKLMASAPDLLESLSGLINSIPKEVIDQYALSDQIQKAEQVIINAVNLKYEDTL
jgi:hypothetical protein